MILPDRARAGHGESLTRFPTPGAPGSQDRCNGSATNANGAKVTHGTLLLCRLYAGSQGSWIAVTFTHGIALWLYTGTSALLRWAGGAPACWCSPCHMNSSSTAASPASSVRLPRIGRGRSNNQGIMLLDANKYQATLLSPAPHHQPTTNHHHQPPPTTTTNQPRPNDPLFLKTVSLIRPPPLQPASFVMKQTKRAEGRALKRVDGRARVALDDGGDNAAVAALALAVLHAESTDDGELGAVPANSGLAAADEDQYFTSLPDEMWAKIFGFVAPKTQVLVVPQVGAVSSLVRTAGRIRSLPTALQLPSPFSLPSQQVCPQTNLH